MLNVKNRSQSDKISLKMLKTFMGLQRTPEKPVPL